MKMHLVIIDPQNDFMDYPQSALPVPGAIEDMKRLAKMIDRMGDKFDDIHLTEDSHRLLDIAHGSLLINGVQSPSWWTNDKGENPPPYTIISVSDVENRIWYPRIQGFYTRSLAYVRALSGTQYPLIIWPPHCLIGTWGHNTQEDLNNSLQLWCARNFAVVDYIIKGSNPWTEHYGALKAEVVDPDDGTTDLNAEFIEMLKEVDIIVAAGEALSHCFLTTMNQIKDNIGPEHLKKIHLLTDATSPVPQSPGEPDFPAISEAWLKDMEALGMVLTTTTEFMK